MTVDPHFDITQRQAMPRARLRQQGNAWERIFLETVGGIDRSTPDRRKIRVDIFTRSK